MNDFLVFFDAVQFCSALVVEEELIESVKVKIVTALCRQGRLTSEKETVRSVVSSSNGNFEHKLHRIRASTLASNW